MSPFYLFPQQQPYEVGSAEEDNNWPKVTQQMSVADVRLEAGSALP